MTAGQPLQHPAAGHPSSDPLTHLVVGPAEHGVTRYALQLAAASRDDRVVRVATVVGPDALPSLTARLPVPPAPVHAHVTDQVFGRDPAQAADLLVALARSCRLSVTLHDLPQPSDGRRHRDRCRAYARIASAAAGVVVSSHHELGLLRAVLVGEGVVVPEVAVVPHAVDALPGVRVETTGPATGRDVAVLGFLYPGKGHEQVLEALADAPADVGLVALGRASDRHQDLVTELRRRGEEVGRRVEVTGWLPDDELRHRLRSIAVPVVAHQHVSASGSLASWSAVGRRPVVLRSGYAEEVERGAPGALQLTDDLPAAVVAALADPMSSWLAPGTRVGPSSADAADQLVRLVRGWA